MAGKKFFAIQGDLEPGLRAIEAKIRLKYVVQGFHTSPAYETFYSAFDLPHFGVVLERAVILNPLYLVLPVDAEVNVETVPQQDGTVLYDIDFDLNPAAIWFRPGGWYEGQCLIGGDISSVPNSPASLALYRPFARALTKGFVKIPDVLNYIWWVGPEALSLLDTGTRLITRDFSAPDDYEDLKRVDSEK